MGGNIRIIHELNILCCVFFLELFNDYEMLLKTVYSFQIPLYLYGNFSKKIIQDLI